MIIRNNAQINNAAFGSGNAGGIDIQLADNLVLDDGIIKTTSENAGGGRITIAAGESIGAVNGSSISTTVLNDAGDAGDIIIETPLFALGDAEVLARAVAGTGGDIQITADDLVLSPDGVINAEAGVAGVDGTIAVSALEADLSGDLAALDGQLLDVSDLLRERCAARRASESSSFTLGTGGTLPPDLDAPRLSLLAVAPNGQGEQTLLVLPCPKSAS